jgi:RHS repeat-associated protein
MFNTAGYISLYAETPSTLLATPAALEMPFQRPNVHVLTDGSSVIQQVKTPLVLVNVVTNDSYKYSLQVFKTNSFSEFPTNGLYITNGDPFVTWVIQNPDTNFAYNQIWITEQRPGLTNRVFKYTYTNNSTYEHRWDLLEPDGTTTISRWQVTSPTNSFFTNLFYQVTSGTNILEATCKTVQVVTPVNGIPAGGVLTRQIIRGVGNVTNATAYVYYPTNAPGGSVHRLRREDHSDGTWVYYTYDEFGRITNRYSTYLNYAPPANKEDEPDPITHLCKKTEYLYEDSNMPFLVTKEIVSIPVYVSGAWTLQEVSRSIKSASGNFSREDRVSQPGSGLGQPGNLVTMTYYYPNGFTVFEQASGGRIKSVSHPDGTATVYTYELSDTNFTTIESTGEPYEFWGAPEGIVNGVETTTVIDGLGRVESRTSKQIENYTVGITLSQQIYVYSTSDPLGRDYYVYDLAGRTNYYEFACCGLSSETDPDEVSKIYGYDIMRNVTTESTLRGSAFITLSYVYDGLGRKLVTQRTGEDAGTNIITLNQYKYDVLGRVVYETNALNGVSSNSYAVVSNQSCTTNTYPDGGTRVEVYYRDGRLQSISGTAVAPVRYDYGVEDVDGYPREYTLEIKLTATGGTNEWVKTFVDAAGRTIKTVYPSASGEVAATSHYDQYIPGGQLLRQVDPDGVTTLFAYNSEGEQSIHVVDMDQDTNIDYDGTDRITMTTNEVVNAHGMDVLRRSTYVWGVDNSDTPQLVSSVDRTPDGQHTWNIIWNNGTAVTSESHMLCYAGSGYCITTNIAPDGAYTVTTNRYGRIISQTQRASNGSQIAHTTYGYDTHGRQNTLTDARTGTTTNWFNAADQLISTKTPVPGSGQSAQVTTNLVDTLGRVWKTTLPDNTSVTNKYDVTGLLTNTAGSRTYPVSYTYDAQGRMKTMKTWQGYANNSGAATTTWNYDIYRGSLTNKAYDGGTAGPTYTYTPAGRLETRAWARGVTTTYDYDSAGGLLTIEYSDSTPAVTNSYNRRGQLIEVICNGMTNTVTFNDVGLVLGEAYSGGFLNGLSVTNGYDQYLRRTNLSLLSSGSQVAATTYGYDNASRLSLVGAGTEKAVYSYLANSPLVEKIWFTNNTTLRMTTTKSHDNLNRLTGIASVAGGSNVAVFNYTYNSANQRTAITNVDSSKWVYQYDALGQVVSGKKYWSDGTPVAGQQFVYGFDDIGNRKMTGAGGDALGANLDYAYYTNNSLNQLTNRSVPGYVNVLGTAKTNATVTLWGDNGAFSATSRKGEYYRGNLAVTNTSALWLGITNLAVLNDGSNPDIVTNLMGKTFVPKTPEAFLYDPDGNLTNDGRWTYTWDAENRLLKQESLNGAPTASKFKLEFAYDSKGRRIQKLVSTNNGSYVAQYTNRFVYDGWNLVAILNPQSAILQAFTWGLDLSGSLQGAGGVGGLLLSRDASAASTNYVTYDGNGNVATLVNAANGAVSASYEHGPFGEAIRVTGALAKANPFRFSSKFQDDESDFLYYGYRSYNPSTGRWLSRDPIVEQGGLHLYGFVRNNPVQLFDYLGLAHLHPWPPPIVPSKPYYTPYYAPYALCSECQCISVKVTYNPGGDNFGIGRHISAGLFGAGPPRWGSDVSVEWTVSGNPAKCSYYQDEKGTRLTLTRVSTGSPGAKDVNGKDGNRASQKYTDEAGFTIRVPGTYDMQVTWKVTFRCVSSNKSTVTRTDTTVVNQQLTE